MQSASSPLSTPPSTPPRVRREVGRPPAIDRPSRRAEREIDPQEAARVAARHHRLMADLNAAYLDEFYDEPTFAARAA